MVAQQTKVHIRIVESGAGPGKPHTILGDCLITDLPTNLSEGSEVEVTISYDAQARVHVAARELKSGKSAETEIIRQENMCGQLQQEVDEDSNVTQPVQVVAKSRPEKAESQSQAKASSSAPNDSLSEEWASVSARLSEFSEFTDPVDHAEQPVLLCNSCGTALSPKGQCSRCRPAPAGRKRRRGTKKKSTRRTSPPKAGAAPAKRKRKKTGTPEAAGKTNQKKRSIEDDFWDLVD